MAVTTDGQKARSLTTQISLMEAAEKLIVKNGMHAVSIKQIVREAGQKNESALQYHFGNMQGLIEAICQRRNRQVQERRAEMLSELLEKKSNPSLRDLCCIMVLPAFSLAKADPRFRRYVAGFSHELVLTEDSALVKAGRNGGGGESGLQTGELLKAALPHLNVVIYRARMDLAIRMGSAALGNYARQKNAFKGTGADFFVENLIDSMEGLLSAPVSKNTKSLQV